MASLPQWSDFEEAPGVGDGQGSLACYIPWDRKDLDTTEQLNLQKIFEKNIAKTTEV